MDKRIYEFLDGWTTYAQTRHGWNLVKIKVWLAATLLFSGLVWANGLTVSRVPLMIFLGGMYGLVLWSRVNDFKADGDYPENIRKCERLNAKVLEDREEQRHLRLLFTPLFAIFLVTDTIILLTGSHSPIDTISRCVWDLSVLLSPYVDCCYHMGPGKHSKELNKQEATNAATSRSAG